MSFDLRTGKPVWMMGRPRLAKHKKLKKNIRSDVVVVGGGISGALMAYRLTNLGMQVTLIDSRTIGAGSTAASTAILSYEADVNLGELIEKIGRTPAVRAYRAGIEAIDLIGKMVRRLDDRCNFRRTQSLYLASSRKDVKLLERECAVRQKYKFRVRLLASEELSAKYGLNAQCAILNEDAAEVDPLKLTQALMRHAVKRGLKVFVHSKVVSYEREGSESILTTEDGREVRARHVVFATGYETQQFLRQKEVKLKSSYAIASKPMRVPLRQKFPVVWETARPYLYVRATADSRMIVGGEDVDFVDEKRRDRLLSAKTKALEKKIRKLMPGIRWKLATAWTGTFAETKDGLPYIGKHKEFPGAYFALGYGGNGITFAAIASMIVPDLIRGGKNSDARIFRFERRSK